MCIKLVQKFAALYIALYVVGTYSLVKAEVEAPIAVVDIQRVINESEAGKSAREKLEEEIKKEGIKLKNMENELSSLQKDFDAQASVLSGNALIEKQEAIRKKQRDVSLSFQDKKNELAKKNQLQIQQVVAKVDKVVGELAKENNYKFVLENDPGLIVYSSPSLDLTDTVIEKLNEQG